MRSSQLTLFDVRIENVIVNTAPFKEGAEVGNFSTVLGAVMFCESCTSLCLLSCQIGKRCDL